MRQEESVLARIRIGHTYMTHSFLLNKEDSPQCIACNCCLIVKQILFDCVDYIESRKKNINVKILKNSFEKVPSDSIFSCSHEIGLFYRLQFTVSFETNLVFTTYELKLFTALGTYFTYSLLYLFLP